MAYKEIAQSLLECSTSRVECSNQSTTAVMTSNMFAGKERIVLVEAAVVFYVGRM